MAKLVTPSYAILNIAASSHPKGVYRTALAEAAARPVKFWGEQFAAITVPQVSESGILVGSIMVWTEVDPTLPTVDKGKLEEVKFSESGVSVPDNIGLNMKAFRYAFNDEKHLLYFENKNELGKTLSPKNASVILSKLLALAAKGENEFAVTVVPVSDALDRVLGLKRIRSLEILITRPNPDDEDVEDIVRELEEEKAAKKKILMVAETGSGGLKPSQRTLAQAELALTNGFVKSSGKNHDGKSEKRNTADHPKILPGSPEISAFSALNALAASED